MITLYKTAGYYTSDELDTLTTETMEFLKEEYPDECKARKVLGLYDSFINDYVNETINDIYWDDFRVNMLDAVYLPYGLRIYGVANTWNGSYRGCENHPEADTVTDALAYVSASDFYDVMFQIDEHDNLILTGGHHDGTNRYTIQALDEHGNAHKLGETIRKYYGIDSEVTA